MGIIDLVTKKKPLEWLSNPRIRLGQRPDRIDEILPRDISRLTRSFHRQIPGYMGSPLKSLSSLASMLGLGGIWVKDESLRLALNSFKVLGGSFAIYRYLQRRLKMDHLEVPFRELTSPETKRKLGEITFAAATDGNHGRGVAWAAGKFGQKAVIYVHEATSVARIKAIEAYGAEVKIIQGTYDDAVRQINKDAAEKGWVVISDTSWEGYEEIPAWVMQGYTTMFSEAQEQLAAQGIVKPTHIFVQAGVGALAASMIGYYRQLFDSAAPISVVIEPDKAACLYESARSNDGLPHSFPGKLDTIMAGLACGDPSPLAWKILRDWADFFVSCPDYVSAKGMRVYGIPLRGDPVVISGESGSVTLGALMFILERKEGKPLKSLLKLGPDSQVLLLNTEGNTDPEHFRRVVWEGADPVPEEFRAET
jgi:diaminopropionate ammonia-lyase